MEFSSLMEIVSQTEQGAFYARDAASALRLPGIAARASNEKSSEPDCHRTLDCPNKDFDATPQSCSNETPWSDATPQSCSAETPWSQWDCCEYSKSDPFTSQTQFLGASDQPVFFCAFGYFSSPHDGNEPSLMNYPCSWTDEGYDCGPQYPMDSTIATSLTQDGYQPLDSQTHADCDSDQQHVVGPTTVMLRNIPGNYTNEQLEERLNEEGFAGCFDGVYLPKDLKHDCACIGYAFINLVSAEEAIRFKEHFDGFKRWRNFSKKRAETSWAAQQGLQSFIHQYRNSPIMHESIPEFCKPRLFKDGEPIPFPAPTKNLTPPKNIGKKKPAPKAEVQWQ